MGWESLIFNKSTQVDFVFVVVNIKYGLCYLHYRYYKTFNSITRYIFVRIQESGVRMFEKLVSYQTSISAVSLKKLTADGCSRTVPLGIS
jgi:hypothetical protein